MGEIHPDFEGFFALLNASKVRYLVIGGVARNAYVEPRFTKDIDVWVEPVRGNCERLLAALADFGFPSEQVDLDDVAALERALESSG